jgi:two-component system cell cycle sensor histidine kinase/response regulator CckA
VTDRGSSRNGKEGSASGEAGPGEGSAPSLAAEIARRQLAEEAWRESEEKYRHLVERTEDPICLHDLHGVILFVNPALSLVSGYEASEMLGRRLDEFLAEESRRQFPAYLEEIVRDGSAQGFMKIRCRSGEQRVLQYDNEVGTESGRPVVRGITHDVQKRWAENALRLSLSRLEALLDNIPDLVWFKDEQGRYSAVNEPLARFFGRRRAEVVGRTDRELAAPDLARRFEESDRRALVSPGGIHVTEEVSGADGSAFHFDTTKTPIRDAKGSTLGTVGIARDVTERRRLEAQLLQSQKMEAIGRLAGGVAHDFNNLLTTILGYSGILLDQLPADDTLRPDIEEIQRAGERASALTQQLLAFSRKQVFEPTLLDLNEIVSEAGRMLGRLVGEDVEFVTNLATGLGSVRADRGQIDQVLMNLVINARDAMPHGGRLTLETREVDAPGPARRSERPEAGRRWIRLSVSDNGIGMDEETRRRIFEPFFTTKERGKGTGLGLATVYGVVTQSGGEIWVESESGRGTTFHVDLPRADSPRRFEAERPAPLPVGGSETILLVEDEEAVRRLAARVLESCGYEVLTASDADEAEDVWDGSRERVRLLLTDVIMPGRSGVELARALTEREPRLKVLFFSGYTNSAIAERGPLSPGPDLLPKPFTPESLSNKVRRVLDEPARRFGGDGPGS